jgi:hypothetical protein
MAKASIFLVVGGFLATVAAVLLLVALWNALPVFLGYVRLVEYAEYMVEAQLVVHTIAFVVLIVPAAFLIRHGLRGFRSARREHV